VSAVSAPRVLVIAPNWLGDAILARPALSLLAQHCRLDVAAPPGLRRVLEDVASVLPSSGWSRRERFRQALGARARRYGGALVLPPSFSAALAAFVSGSRLRVGHATEARRVLLSHPVPNPGRTVHLTTQFLDLAAVLLRLLGVPIAAARAPALPVHPEERLAAQRLLESRGVTRPYLAVAPGARYGPSKRYPPERFAAAAASLAAAQSCDVVLVGEAADAAATAAVHAALPAAVDLCGTTSLAALVGVLAGARGVLANDSGTMHLAASLGVPVVGVFGSTDPRWTSPRGERAAFVVHPVKCAPCFAPTCRVDFGCMLGIAPEELVAALEGQLAKGDS
jgi:heptosyltransferase-2